MCHILGKMEETGVDYCLDVHGDEGLEAAVMCCAPAWTPRLEGLQLDFYRHLDAINPDFSMSESRPHMIQTLHGANTEDNCGV